MGSVKRRTVVRGAVWAAPVVLAGIAAPAASASDGISWVTRLWPAEVRSSATWSDSGTTQSVPTTFKVILGIETETPANAGTHPIPIGDSVSVSYDTRLLGSLTVSPIQESGGGQVSDPLHQTSGPVVSGNVATVSYSVPAVSAIGKYSMDSVGPVISFGDTPTDGVAAVRDDYEPIVVTWTSTIAGILPPDSLDVTTA